MVSEPINGMLEYCGFVLCAYALALLLLFWERKQRKMHGRVPFLEMALVIPVCTVLMGRLVYVIVRLEEFVYEYGVPGIINPRVGGCSLIGSIAGAALGAAFLARAHKTSIGRTLDELAAPGLLAIAVCRAGEFFIGEGIGPLIENEGWQFFPMAVQNEYGEWNLAVFILEAFCASVILCYMLQKGRHTRGQRFMTALVLFCACQIPLENLRSDNCLRIGFVRVTQLAAALAILAVVFCRFRKERRALAVRAGMVIASSAMIGLLEWAEDKTNIPNPVIYAVMIALCAVMAVCTKKRRHS